MDGIYEKMPKSSKMLIDAEITINRKLPGSEFQLIQLCFTYFMMLDLRNGPVAIKMMSYLMEDLNHCSIQLK